MIKSLSVPTKELKLRKDLSSLKKLKLHAIVKESPRPYTRLVYHDNFAAWLISKFTPHETIISWFVDNILYSL